MDDAAFATLVASKLSRDEVGETFRPYNGAARPPEPFEQYVEQARKAVEEQLQRRLHQMATPPAPHLSTVKSWQHGFTGSRTRSEAERAARDALFLRIQAWGHAWVSAKRWKQCLAAFDSPERWIALAREIQEEGRIVESNAALAAACWLDPAASRAGAAALIAARPPELPSRLREQPDPAFRAKPFLERHWSAWDMKNYALLDLPSLLAFESDENFSVRARVVRSLGQRPHPASIQALQEGTFDPHPFARAQAIRSLGWCADPTSLGRLEQLASEDPDRHARRAADQASQRIRGFWTFFGEWAARTSGPTSCIEMARELVARGLPRVARDMLCSRKNELDEDDAELARKLCNIDSEQLLEAPERDYTHWFGEARRVEAAVRGGPKDREQCRRALADEDSAARSLALLQVSAHGHEELLPDVEALVGAPEPVGWGARRALRCMGRGTMPQRRALFPRSSWSL